jgi:hypothetical protein
MSLMTSLETVEAFRQRSVPVRRQVAIRRDGADFVAAFQPDGHIIFRHQSAYELRKLCQKLKWEIVSDTSAEP